MPRGGSARPRPEAVGVDPLGAARSRIWHPQFEQRDPEHVPTAPADRDDLVIVRDVEGGDRYGDAEGRSILSPEVQAVVESPGGVKCKQQSGERAEVRTTR